MMVVPSLTEHLALLTCIVIINGASGFDQGLASELIEGLAQRKQTLGGEVHYIHVSTLLYHIRLPQ